MQARKLIYFSGFVPKPQYHIHTCIYIYSRNTFWYPKSIKFIISLALMLLHYNSLLLAWMLWFCWIVLSSGAWIYWQFVNERFLFAFYMLDWELFCLHNRYGCMIVWIVCFESFRVFNSNSFCCIFVIIIHIIQKRKVACTSLFSFSTASYTSSESNLKATLIDEKSTKAEILYLLSFFFKFLYDSFWFF